MTIFRQYLYNLPTSIFYTRAPQPSLKVYKKGSWPFSVRATKQSYKIKQMSFEQSSVLKYLFQELQKITPVVVNKITPC